MPLAAVNGIDLYHERQGAGPRLLFVNGSGGDLRRPPVIFDSPLGRRFDLLAYDHRGLGQSSRPENQFEMFDLADDAAALLDHIGWDQCHVFGISFGAMVAQEIALRHPDKIERLVLGCGPSGGAGGASYPLHTLGNLNPRERAQLLIPILDTRRGENWQAEHPEYYQGLVEDIARVFRSEDDDPATARGLALQLDARSRHDTWDRLDQIAATTFVCGGKYDASATPESLERMASRIPNAKFHLFEGGHRFWLDDPTAYDRIIEFLTE